MRRLALAAAVAALLPAPAPARGCGPRTPPDPRVPAWEAVNGFALGSRAASPDEIDRYLLAVDRASPRVRTFLAGRSLQGRPIRYAAVGRPRDLARLARLAARARALRTGRGRPRALPAFVWLVAGAHGNEPSGADADVRLLAQLAAGRTCADLERLRRAIVFLLPAQNPDGRVGGTRTNAAGFDLNRDWFARTQPETRARLRALTRFPPVVLADQHEQSGRGFFFPPNADPVHHEVPAAALQAIRGVVAPRLRRAFGARGLAYTNYATYDLFFMGYADTVSATLFGAAGMTFEKGRASPYAVRTAEQLLAAQQTVAAAAARRAGLVRRWAASWREARAQGAAGRLQPNRVVQPGNRVRFAVPNERVYGYLLRADVHAADAAALVHRLRAAGVRVRRLSAEAAVAGYRDYHAAAAGALPAGTYYVPMAQPAKHWVEAMLGRDPYVPFPYFYDVSSWSNPLLMGLEGGWVTQPLAVRTAPVAGDVSAPDSPGGFLALGGSEGSVELAFAVLARGLAARRLGDGSFALSGDARAIAAAAAARHVPLQAADRRTSAGGRPLRLPRTAMLADLAPGDSGAWTRWLLERRYGLRAPSLSGADIAAGRLAAVDALVVAEGASSPSQLSPAALLALQAWVRGGGTLVGIGSRGVGVGRAAGVTAVSTRPTPPGTQIPGVALATVLDTADPVAAGEGSLGWVFNDGDPILDAGTARAVVRYASGPLAVVSGYAAGTGALQGTPAVTAESAGAGRVVLFASDPAFRGYAEGTERLLGNALLGAGQTRSAARARATAGAGAGPPAAVDASALALPSPARDATVQVAATDERTLLAAARAAGVPAAARLERDLTTVTLRVDGAAALGGEPPPWARRLPLALARAGVLPLLAVL